MNSVDALAASDYQLVGAGPDGVFGTSDDITYTLTPQSVSDSNQVTLNIAAGSLPPGLYRLTVLAGATGGIHDVNGLLLDGDNNGTPGGNYVRTFTVVASSLNLNTNNVYLKLDADGQHIDVWNNATATGSPTQYLLSGVSSITYSGPAGNDDFVLDFSAGDPLPASGLAFTGGSGQNILKIIGTTGSDTVSVNASTVTVNGVPITYAAVGTIIIDGDAAGSDVLTQTAQPGGGANLVFSRSTALDTLNINAGTFTIAANAPGSGLTPFVLGTLSIASGSKLQVISPASHSDRTVLTLNSLQIAGVANAWTSQLDLAGNDLVIHNGNLATILNQIEQGLNAANHGYWNGLGITSSAAAAASNLALAAELNSNGSGALLSSFDNQSVLSTDVLVKFTYFGDANLDGVVNGSDYTLIDNGFNNNLTGVRNGDFNYDGVVNGDDYTLIDNAFNTQNLGPLAVVSTEAVAAASAEIAPIDQGIIPMSAAAAERKKIAGNRLASMSFGSFSAQPPTTINPATWSAAPIAADIFSDDVFFASAVDRNGERFDALFAPGRSS